MHSESRDGAKVIWLAVHTTEGIMRATALRDWTSWSGSSHASSDETGALLGPADGFVPYNLAAWTLRAGNRISENIEQCGWARWTRGEWLSRPKLLEATARWLAERSAARGIPLVRLSAADIRARKPGVLGHGDYSVATGDGTHSDPGRNYPWDVVLSRAQQIRSGGLAAASEEEFTVSQYDEIMRYLKSIDARISGDVSDNEDNIGAILRKLDTIDAEVSRLTSDPGGPDRLRDVWTELQAIRGMLPEAPTAKG